MENALVVEKEPITLVGGAKFDRKLLKMALDRAPQSVGADGGGSALIADGQIPLAVIGDMDSIDPFMSAKIPADRFHPIAEQDSTDFEKCLMRVEAPALISVGFWGREWIIKWRSRQFLCVIRINAVYCLGKKTLYLLFRRNFRWLLNRMCVCQSFRWPRARLSPRGSFGRHRA